MIKFNPDNKESLTYGEALDPLAKIETKEEAQQYLADYIKFCQKFATVKDTAESIAKNNIGYYAGYFDEVTRKKLYSLFDTNHPVLTL